MVVSGGVWLFFVLAGMKQQPPKRDQPEKVYTVEAFLVEKSDVQEIITAFGSTRPNREVTLDAQVSGEIVEVHGPRHERGQETGLKVGQQVRGPEIRAIESGISERFAGDLLLRIDPATYQERIAQAQNRIDEDAVDIRRLEQEQKNNDRLLAKVTDDYKQYQKQYNRVKRLHQMGSATDSELTAVELELGRYEDAKIQHENDKALLPIRIERLKKQQQTHRTDLAIAQLDLNRTVVRPPFSGVISEVLVEQGKYVNVGEPLFRLTDISEIEIPLPLTLHDYAKIERKLLAGEMPRVELAEHETAPTRWVGYVVRRAPEADTMTRTVEVFVHVENHGRDNQDQPIALLPSVFVHARIDGPILEQVIIVPRDAIRDGKLFVVKNPKPVESTTSKLGSPPPRQSADTSTALPQTWEGIAEERSVTIVRTLRTLAIVTRYDPTTRQGLKPGDHVVMTNLDVIHNGVKVRIETRYDLKEALDRQGTPALRPLIVAGSDSKEKRDAMN
jgi:multidrug efflux pump subunit AcrA (membrane-fusion protein)